MKKLSFFEKFDWESFIKGKKLAVAGINEYVDFETKKHLGTKVKVVIIEDHTDYGIEGGNPVSNKYESMTFKCFKDIDLPLDSIVVAKGVKATVYGEYHNQLSLYADDILPVNDNKGTHNA